MEKLLKYYLSFYILLVGISCKEEGLSIEKRRVKAEKIYKEASNFKQGSVSSMLGIEKSVAIDPTFDKGVRELSVAYLKRGIPFKWKDQLDKAVAINPEEWIGYRGYNYLWFYRDYKKAIADFDATDTLTPNFIDFPQGHSVDYWRGIAYLGLKDYENSISYFQKHMNKKIKDSGEDWIELKAFLYTGIAYYESGNTEKAIFYFDKVLHYNNGNYADAKYYKALILKEKGEVLKAQNLIIDAIADFENGYINKRPYVESLRQLYLEDYNQLKKAL